MRHLGVVLCLAFALSGCSDKPEDVLAGATANLDQIDSGVLDVRLVATGTGENAGQEFGFELSGPFQLPAEGELPVTELTYTQIAGAENATNVFVATGENAFIEIDGTFYEMPPERVESLRGGPEDEDPASQLEGLGVEEWVVEPELSEGEDVGGDATQRITGELDVVEAFNDLFDTARNLGATSIANVPPLEGDNAEQLRNAVESASIEVLVGEDDGLLRRLEVEIDFEVKAASEVREALGALGGASFSLFFEISDPNQEVVVEEPPDALPFEELAPEG